MLSIIVKTVDMNFQTINKKMKTTELIINVLACIVLLSACDRSEQDFQKAAELGTVSAYDNFITNHQKSELVDDARDSIVAFF